MKTNTEIRDVVIELNAVGLDVRQRRLVIAQMGGMAEHAIAGAMEALRRHDLEDALHGTELRRVLRSRC